MDLPPVEQLVASAINYLIQGEETDAATLLLFSTTEIEEGYDDFGNPEIKAHITGPRQVYDTLHATASKPCEQVRAAFDAIIRVNTYVHIIPHAQLVDIEPGWREELLQIAGGRSAHNQGVEIPNRKIVEWRGLRFRSEPERRIAVALDTAGVMFLPNCLARLKVGETRATREADFLVCHEGKWGILEVDGPFHPRAVVDHERDRQFQQYRIRVIQRFDWQECLSDAPGVVQQFLRLLERNG